MKDKHRSGNLPAGPARLALRRYVLPLALIIAAGVGLSILLYRTAHQWERNNAEAEFTRAAERYSSGFKSMFMEHLSNVAVAATFCKVTSPLDREKFRRFVQPILIWHNEIRAIGWVARVRDDERDAWEARVSEEGIPEATIREVDGQGKLVRAGRRDRYYAIEYLETRRDARMPLGLDLASEPDIAPTLEWTRDSGHLNFAPPTLSLHDAFSSADLRLIIPIYKNGIEVSALTTETRRTEHRGYILGVFHIADLVKSALGDWRAEEIELRIFDVTTSEPILLYARAPQSKWTGRSHENAAMAALRHEAPFNISRSKWSIVCAPTPDFTRGKQTWQPVLILVAGLIVTGILSSYVLFLLLHAGRARRSAEQLAGIKRNLEAEIVERKAAEQEIQARATILDFVGDCVFLHDEQGNIVYANEGACRKYGYTREELLRVNLNHIAGPEHAIEISKYMAAVADNDEAIFESSGLRKGGEVFPTEVHANIVHLYGRRLILGLARDISERKRLEAEFRQAQKMEAVGRLAGGVAHDFNNLLTTILGCSEFGRLVTHPDERIHTYFGEIQTAAEHAANLTRQLLAFSRRQPLDPRVVSLNDVVLNIERMLRRTIGEDIELKTVLARDLWPVRVDSGQIDQVIMNLAINARDAMPRGGTLKLSTANLFLSPTEAAQAGEMGPGDYVLLSIGDTGLGMTEEVKARAFEPFFTTKELGCGTGLGLATCYGIVKQSGGHIMIDSTPGQGATFQIYLKASREAEVPPVAPRLPTAAPRGNETILLAEDEPSVRSLASLILTEHGYRVLEASNGIEALEMIDREDCGLSVDLLLTDVVMPKMGGQELAARLRDRQPNLRVLFTSGYSEHPPIDSEFESRASRTGFLQKPFTPGTLAQKVHEVLNFR